MGPVQFNDFQHRLPIGKTDCREIAATTLLCFDQHTPAQTRKDQPEGVLSLTRKDSGRLQCLHYGTFCQRSRDFPQSMRVTMDSDCGSAVLLEGTSRLSCFRGRLYSKCCYKRVLVGKIPVSLNHVLLICFLAEVDLPFSFKKTFKRD